MPAASPQPVRASAPRQGELFPKSAFSGHPAERKFLRVARERLIGDLGTSSAVRLAVVDRVVHMQLRLWQLEARLASGEALTSAEEKSYASLSSCVCRALDKLRQDPQAKPARGSVVSLSDYLAAKA
jgi:hypothetical protein